MSLEDVVYVHCHQGENGGGTVVLVGQDGVQHPPIHFPKGWTSIIFWKPHMLLFIIGLLSNYILFSGGHLLAFLSCLETGLLPHGQLDPPLWSQRGTGKV